MADEKQYGINEIFYSIQGEGLRAGTANFFLRFAGCNMRCDVEPGDKSPGGFACDTEFMAQRKMTFREMANLMRELNSKCTWIIFTGGEPALQVSRDLCHQFVDEGFKLAIETNGSISLEEYEHLLSWITVSPKVAEHAIKQRWASEVKYVRGYQQPLPDCHIEAQNKLISPAFDGTELDHKTLKWCVDLVKDNPDWTLTVQAHKLWKVR